VDRAEALQALPATYAIALRLRDEVVEHDAVARVLDVEPEALGPLLTLAEAKLAGLGEVRGSARRVRRGLERLRVDAGYLKVVTRFQVRRPIPCLPSSRRGAVERISVFSSS
jgi:hypothetical protein